MGRQLNIRSDEAVATAHQLSKHLGKTTTEVVVEALRAYSARCAAMSSKTTPAQVEADLKTLHAMIAEANKNRLPGMTSDHRDMYDDDGFPI